VSVRPCGATRARVRRDRRLGLSCPACLTARRLLEGARRWRDVNDPSVDAVRSGLADQRRARARPVTRDSADESADAGSATACGGGNASDPGRQFASIDLQAILRVCDGALPPVRSRSHP